MKKENLKFQLSQFFWFIKKSLLVVGFILCVISFLSAQTAKEQISADICKSASNNYAYPVPDASVKQTPAPKGYKPFYISHYGRHGSRYLSVKKQYEGPMKTLSLADEAGVLTTLGKDVKNRLVILSNIAQDRYGELTLLGAKQHRGIAERMFWNFPEVFKGNTIIDARSTTAIRCILSMSNECLRFKELNPNLQIYSDASVHDMYYLSYYGKINESYRNDSVPNAFKLVHNKSIHPERLTKLIFTDAAYVEKEVNSYLIWSQLFELASSIQNLDENLSLYDLFTKEECYEQWLSNNVDSYMNFGHSPWTKGSMPYTQSNLLNNILNTSDSIIATGKNAVTLRFGHDMFLMPLACLMELGTCGLVIDNADELADKWQDYNIFPMGGNIQMIFFLKNNSNDILVKVLLNELEVNLPVKSEFAPYYHWSELEAYYRNKLTISKDL